MKSDQLRHVLAKVAAVTVLAFPIASWGSFAEGEEAYLKNDLWGAFRTFVELAKAGDAPAQAMIARMYLDGQGAVKDPRTAASFYEKAANQGHAASQYQLAKMYSVGAGVKQDPARAAQLMEKSADQGVLWAMYSMGLMYREGTGVAKDAAQALKWIALAAASPESAATADYIKLAKTAKAELEASMAADRVRESEKMVTQWNAAKRVRDTQWQKAINRPIEVRASEVRPVNPEADKDKQLIRDYYPQSK